MDSILIVLLKPTIFREKSLGLKPMLPPKVGSCGPRVSPPMTKNMSIFQCYRRTWWGIIQSSSPSKWKIRTAGHNLTETWFLLPKSVDFVRSDVLKNFGLVDNEMNDRLDFLLVRLVFRRYEFLVVFAHTVSPGTRISGSDHLIFLARAPTSWDFWFLLQNNFV